jgi:hypothetical protein
MNKVKESINEESTTGAAIAGDELESLKDQAHEFEPVNEGEPVNEELEMKTAQAIELVLSIGFKGIAPNWEIKPEECSALAESYGAALDFYFPDLGGGLPPWMIPVATTAAIIGPRMNTPRIKEEKTVNGGDDASTES